MTNLNQWFDIGISQEKYKSALDHHRDAFLHIYHQFSIPETDIKSLQQHKNIRAIVLAEVWCGHCMLDIPIFLRLAEKAGIQVSFLPRDEHLELMDQYLTNNKRFIPIIIFIDEAGNELTTWGPMAPEINTFVEKQKRDLPDKTDPSYDSAFQDYIKVIGETFTSDENFWQYVYADMTKTLLHI